MGIFMILILLLLSSCRTLFPPVVEEKTISTLQSWAYQLQNIDLFELERSSYDLLVIDYSKDGSDGGKWSSSEIRRVKEAGGGKILLAYLSIGKAETHRSYWNNSWVPGNPPWVGREDITSDGRPTRFHVKYWDSEWMDILKNLVDSMISQGFSGVLLDGCDAYTYWSDSRNGESEVLSMEDAADRMVGLITELSRYARNRANEFIVFTQERTTLLTASNIKDSYLSSIQGVVAPEIFFPGEALIDNPYAPQSDLVEYFKDIRSRGKVVCSLEYLSQTNTGLDRYFQQAKTYGFLPYGANRALDTLRSR
jgi:cysteinyl-tRNA synthetase